LQWTKFIWNVSIPPSKSIVVWWSLHQKLPIDASLVLRGCHLPSMCSLREAEIEQMNIFFWIAGMFRTCGAGLDLALMLTVISLP
jgi:hypothetical protein